MTLIDDILINGERFYFYDGIDFNMISNYTGTDFHIFLIDSWIKEVNRWQRDSRLNNLLNGELTDFNPNKINNNFICIYQTNGDLQSMYNIIKKKLTNGNYINFRNNI
jgi:hypothetical protein